MPKYYASQEDMIEQLKRFHDEDDASYGRGTIDREPMGLAGRPEGSR